VVAVAPTIRTPAIRLPANPFWEVFKTFGRDELTGGVIALIATAIIEASFYAYNGGTLGAVFGSGGSGGVEIAAGVATFTATQMLLLAFAGPVLEKIGFFVWHFKEARDTYNTTPVIYRKDYGHYVKQALRGGGKTLMWDILLHDPLYVLLMLFGMKLHPSTPAWLLVPVAFGVAVVAVAFLEVAVNELRYKWFTHKLCKRGFDLEQYYDARLYLDPSVDPKEVITVLKNRFLPDQPIHGRHYQDHYYPVGLSDYNGRQGRLRVRHRDAGDNEEWQSTKGKQPKTTTAQYIYSRTVEDSSKGVGQFRFFPRIKDKHYNMHHSLHEALYQAELDAKALGSKEDPVIIDFDRYMVADHDTLYMAVDAVNDSWRVIELKVYPDKLQLLIEAMHFVMHYFPAQQTTDRKIDLIEFE
jgi:hypothetical protein